MDFETQVLDTLDRLENKIGDLVEWKAGLKPICEMRAKEIAAMSAKINGNGNKGIVRRLDAVEEVAVTIRRVWIALLIAGALAVASFISQLYQEADNPHGNNEEIHDTNPVH